MNSPEHTRPWFASDQARRVHFFVPLQDPVALPDGTSFVRELSLEVGTVRDALPLLVEPPDPDVNLDGPIFPVVHIIFHRIDGRSLDLTPITRTAEAVQRRLGVKQDEIIRVRTEVQALESSTDNVDSWWSIAELIFEDYGLTPELGPAQRAGEHPDWFMLSLEALAEVIQAYRIATKSPMQEVSYSRLPPVMFAITVPMLGGGAEGTPDAAYYTLNSWGGQWIDTQSDDLDTESVLDYTTRLAQRLSVNDPLLIYTDRMWRARRALEVEGEFDSAVLHAAIAVEAYLVALWLHLQWEKGEAADSALSRVGQLGGKKPTKTILSWLGQDLGGVWRSESNARVAAWVDGLMPLRNRVAHAGVRVSRREAELSVAAAEEIERFAAERVEERWATYPRTAVLAIGHDRLRKRWGDSSVDMFFERTRDEPFYAIAFASWVSSDGQGPQAR